MDRGRERSHWGWGWADRFPDAETRRGLGMQAAAVLGIAPREPREPVPLEAIAPSAPRVEVPAALAAFCTDDRVARIRSTRGRAYADVVRGFHGDFASAPDLVASPRSEDEIASVLEWASREKLAVVPRGGGTSVVGGVDTSMPSGFAGVVALDLTAIDRVVEVDDVSHAARIQCGARGPVLEEQLAAHGMTLRFFPQSFEHSTLGGWIATRAGGHFATVYTHVDDLVESIRTLTPRGALESRRLPASGAGPSPDRLILGSEGILGVVVEAWMRVRPRPRFRSTASVRFAEWRAAVDAVRAIAQSGLFPSNCRLLDAREAMLNFVANDGSNVLVLGFESADGSREPWMERALAIAASHGGRCPDGPRHRDEGAADRGGDAAAWRQAFIDAPYLQNVMVSLGVIADTFETACTWDRFPALHEAVTNAVREAMRRACGGGDITCRFTHVYPDGPAPYYTFVAPGREREELDQWTEIKRAASDALIAHGATITHHHAVGRTHRPWYDAQRPPLFAESLRAVKHTLDPANILNPGVLLD